jgi:hypothetical protein
LYDINSLAALTSADDEDWRAVSERTLEEGGWLVAGFHGVDDGTVADEALGWEALPLRRFRGVLDYLMRQDYWIAPFGRVVRYIRERDSARVEILQEWPWRIVLDVEDDLDDEVYDQALTFAMVLPEGWQAVEVRQGDMIMKSEEAPDGSLLFDSFPSSDPVVLTRLPRFPASLH